MGSRGQYVERIVIRVGKWSVICWVSERLGDRLGKRLIEVLGERLGEMLGKRIKWDQQYGERIVIIG